MVLISQESNNNNNYESDSEGMSDVDEEYNEISDDDISGEEFVEEEIVEPPSLGNLHKGDEYLQQFQEGNWTMKDTQFNYVSEPMPPGCGPQKVPPSTESATEQDIFKYFFTGLFLHGEINL